MASDQTSMETESLFAFAGRRNINFVRRVAYVAAILFMLAMAGNGILASKRQLEASALASVDRVATTLSVVAEGSAGLTPSSAQRILDTWSGKGLSFQLLSQEGAVLASAGPPPVGAPAAVIKPLNAGKKRLVARIDDRALFWAALNENLGPIVFILILGTPVLLSFFYLRKTIHQPAFDLLDYVHSSHSEAQAIPDLPGMWRPAIDRFRELRSIRSQLFGFLDHIPASMYLQKLDGEIVYVNPVTAEQYGMDRGAVQGRNQNEFHAPEFLAALGQIDQQIIATGKAFQQTAHNPTRDRHELVCRFPVIDETGNVSHIGGFNLDIDEGVKAQAERDHARMLMQTAFDSAPVYIVIYSGEGGFAMANTRAAEQCGMTMEQFLSDGYEKMPEYWPEYYTVLEPVVGEVMATRSARTVTTIFQRPDRSDEKLNLEVTFFPILDAEGNVKQIGTIARDMTAQIKAQQESTAATARLQSFIDAAPVSMTIADLRGRHVMLNAVAAGHYNATAEELLAGDHQRILDAWPEHETRIVPLIRKLLATKTTQVAETRAHSESAGRDIDLLLSLFPIFNSDGDIELIGTIGFDISEIREAQHDLVQAQSALHQSEKLASLGSMLAGVSHELNNPLAAVIGQTAMLAEDVENTPHAERVEKIRRAAERCAKIVQSFLAMARQKAPEYETVSPNELIRAAIDLTDFQMKATNVEVIVELDPHLPDIEADPDQLHQVIVNLLTNARQALEDKVVGRQLRITSSARDGMIRLTVADNGAGIPPDLKLRIFDPFFTTKEAGAGTGLGLPFSLGIAEAHGGTIQLDDVAIGTSFTIVLPVAGSRTTTIAKPGQPAPVAERVKGRALIIDDEEEVADTLADMLERMGFDIVVAVGGQAALTILAAERDFDLILSDVRMPDVDGPALRDWILAQAPELLERLAFVTGDTLSGTASDFLEQCGRPYLEKPFTPAALQALVMAIMA